MTAFSTGYRAATIWLVLLAGGFSGMTGAAQLPDDLHPEARQAFEQLRTQPRERAFAVGAGGAWGQSWGHERLSDARQASLDYCREHADPCRVIAVNDQLLVEEHPFATRDRAPGDASPPWPIDVSRPVARWLAALGAVILVAGTLVSEHFPLMVRIRRGFRRSTTQVVRMNYTIVIFATVYFLCVMPLMAHLAPDDTTDVWQWIVFGLPIVPAALSVLYLQYRGRLSQP